MPKSVTPAELCALTALALLASGLQAPTKSYTTITTLKEPSSCPGYHSGNPGNRNMSGCETGTGLGPVDHMMAFGFNTSHNPDWITCGLPELPGKNARVCYRTVVDECSEGYRIHLNRRNGDISCLSETEQTQTALIQDGDSARILQSPRFGCQNERNKTYMYRKSELCLYNISIPDCLSGAITLDISSDVQGLQERADANSGEASAVCADYLQLYYGSSSTQRFCGDDLSLLLPLQIPTTEFLAVFWADPSINALGFKLRARCTASMNN